MLATAAALGVAVALAFAPAPLWAREAGAAAVIAALGLFSFLFARGRTVRDGAPVARQGAAWWGRAPLVGGAAMRQLPPDRRTVFDLVAERPESTFASTMRALEQRIARARTPAAPAAVVIVAPVENGVGASSTALAFAATGAQRGARVLLVDTDLHGRGATRAIGLEDEPGLWDILRSGDAWTSMIHPVDRLGIDILAAGSPVGDLREAATHPGFAPLIQAVCAQYDLVVLDAPAAAHAPDAALLSHHAGVSVLVARYGRTGLGVLARSLALFRRLVQGPRVAVIAVGGPAETPDAERERSL